jgi:hypothetical protein
MSIEVRCVSVTPKQNGDDHYTVIFQSGLTKLSNTFPKLRRVYLTQKVGEIDIWVLSETWRIRKRSYVPWDLSLDSTMPMIWDAEISGL